MHKRFEHYYPVILAGGSGTRLWPISRVRTPKQLSMKLDGASLLERAYRTMRKGFPRSAVCIATNAAAISLVRKTVPGLPRENLFIEPVMRNTAPAVGLAAVMLARRDPDAVIVTVNSDAWIGDAPAFLRTLLFARRIVRERSNHLVFVGINPRYPETGYGYLEMGRQVLKHHDGVAFTLLSFTEKPSLAAAKKYLARGKYLWNPTLVAARADRLLQLYDRHLPAVGRGLRMIAHAGGASHIVKREFLRMPSVSIDYGIFEKLKENILVVPADFGWTDVGSFRTVHEILSHTTRCNVVRGSVMEIDATNNLVLPEREKLVALVGVNNIIMVETDDAILLCHKERTQEVRKIVEILKRRKMTRYL